MSLDKTFLKISQSGKIVKSVLKTSNTQEEGGVTLLQQMVPTTWSSDRFIELTKSNFLLL